MEVMLSDVQVSKTFKVANIEFIKFAQEGDRVIVVTKDLQFNSYFGKNNNFSESDVLKKLLDEMLPKIEAAIGTENVLEFETDLFSLDGSREYGVMKSKVALPTFDFYRNNREIFNKYSVDGWWWLTTPDSTPEYNSSALVVCVSPSGRICCNISSYYCSGVRPFYIFNSSISVSCEE